MGLRVNSTVSGVTGSQVAGVTPHDQKRAIVRERLDSLDVVDARTIAETTRGAYFGPRPHDDVEREAAFAPTRIDAFAATCDFDARPHICKCEPCRDVTAGAIRFALRILQHKAVPQGSDIGSFRHDHTNRGRRQGASRMSTAGIAVSSGDNPRFS